MDVSLALWSIKDSNRWMMCQKYFFNFDESKPIGLIADDQSYPHAGAFYERFMAGEITEYQTGWVNPDDYEGSN